MKLLLKYLKPYRKIVIIALILLFAQAFTNLILPNFMSDLVNTGIQQKGIDTKLPEFISDDALQSLNEFYTEEQEEEFSYYYDFSEDINLGTLKDLEPQELNRAYELYTNSSYALFQIINDSAQEQNLNLSLEDLTSDFFSTLNSMLSSLPEDEKLQLYNQSESIEAGLKSEVSATFTQLIYTDLGLDLDSMQMDYIYNKGIIMLLITILGMFATIGVGYFASKLGGKVAQNFRSDIFNKVISFAGKEYNDFSTATLITRTTNDVSQVQLVIVLGIRILCYAPIMAIGGIVMALNQAVSLSWIIGLTVIVLLGIIAVIFSIVLPRFKIIQTLTDKLNLIARENLTGLMVIRAFNNQRYEEKRFDSTNNDMRVNTRVVQKTMGRLMPSITFIMNITTLAIVWVGAQQIENSGLQIGDMMAFIQYSMQIIMSFLMITMMFMMIPRASISLTRINEVLEKEFTVLNKDNAITTPIKGNITFRDVEFKYDSDSANVLEDLNFTIDQGKTTAIIGPTGSGKSTLIKLIPRFFDVTSGSVEIDGVDVRDYDRGYLRENIGFVPQKNILFSGTIADNLKFGNPNASENEMERVINLAQAENFTLKTEDGLNQRVTQEGSNFSGGQKQRLSIARALIKDSPIFIFDDSFSALDFKTDLSLRKALSENLGDATIIIVAQRIHSIINADKILVMDHGKIVGSGTHEELLENCDVYLEIAKSQLPEDAI